MPTPTSHAKCSPSGAHRWLFCTAAPTFESQFPECQPTKYMLQGTLAHSFCELYARKQFLNLSQAEFKKQIKKLQADPNYEEEMLRTAQAYTDYIQEQSMTYKETPYIALETMVDISNYVPECFGTCDCVMIGGDHLRIIDYKNGSGVPVSAKENPQLRLYALGAIQKYSMFYEVKTVSTEIFQPNTPADKAPPGPNVEQITVQELLDWGEKIKPAALEAFSGPGAFNPGDKQCQFCRGKNRCRARAKKYMDSAAVKDQLVAKEAPPPSGRHPPALSDEEIGELLVQGEQLVTWYNSLKKYAQEAALGGKVIPGWKLVEGRSSRDWVNQDAAFTQLQQNGIDEAILYERKPVSVPGLEKALGKSAFEQVATGLWEKKPGKPTLVAESDPRPTYQPAKAAFQIINENE